jgi:hypothetical protein
LPEAGILLKGQIYRPWYNGKTSVFVNPVKLKNKGNDEINLYSLPKDRIMYFWDVAVTIDDYSADASIEFYVFADNSGNNKHFILIKAELGEVSFDFSDPFDIYGKPEDFPFLCGYVNISGRKYSVYAVLDNNPGKTTYSNEIFFNLLQKFQFLDNNSTVVSELEKNIYTIYDTAEEAGRPNLKYAAVLLLAFRHSAMVMKSLEDRWDPPRSYWYDYP